MLWVQLLVYVSVAVFVVAVAARIRKYATAPIHVRWELYPVAHEGEKKHYGGSYYEELEWWKKPIKKSLFSELTAMAEEIFLLKGVYEHNRPLWTFSYPFHLGLYLLVALIGLLLVGSIGELLGISVNTVSPSWIGKTVYILTILVGYVGLTLALVGCLGLFIKRLQEPSLKSMTSPADYANLGYMFVLLVCALGTWLLTDPTFAVTRQAARALITFQSLPAASGVIVLELVLFSLFLLYFPFTRMVHMFSKYFTYHQVRWDDTPNLPGGPLEGRIREALSFGVSWSAPHIQSGKTWAEVASEMPKEDQA